MSLNTAILLIALLDLGVVLAVAAIMFAPYLLDRQKDDAIVTALEAPEPLDLAA
jgi:hypothetical protein